MVASFYHEGYEDPLLMLIRRRGVDAGLVIKVHIVILRFPTCVGFWSTQDFNNWYLGTLHYNASKVIKLCPSKKGSCHSRVKPNISLWCHEFTAQVDDKVGVSDSLHWTPVCEWYLVWCGSKNGYQKDMCLIEIGLCAQIMITILSSIFKIFGGPTWPFNEHKNL